MEANSPGDGRRSKKPKILTEAQTALKEKLIHYCSDPSDEDIKNEPLIPELQGNLVDFEEAWKYFVWMEATNWMHLPSSGGLEDQDDMLMNNIFAIKTAVRKVLEAKSHGR